MRKEFTCILCPNGCNIEVLLDKRGIILETYGNLCEKGRGYAEGELLHPTRNIASSVLVEGGDFPLASVRLTKPIPRERIFEVMEEIKKCRLKAPVEMGQVVIKDVLGLSSDVIATRKVWKQEKQV